MAAAVTFYLGDSTAPEARLQLACRVTERAYRAGHAVLVLHADPESLRRLDELLWTFGDGSFVPHEALGALAAAEAPVLLAHTPPPGDIDVLVNLTDALPQCLERTRRVAEILDGDPARRSAGRARFRAYREAGIEPETHAIRL